MSNVVFPILLALHVLGLLSSVHAVMVNRTAQGAIAWGISLNAFPGLVVPLYWVFGRRKFEGYSEAFRERAAEVDALTTHLRRALEPYEVKVLTRLPDYAALKKLAR